MKEEEQRQTGLVRAQAARQGDTRGIARAGRIQKPGYGQVIAPAVPAPFYSIRAGRVGPPARRWPTGDDGTRLFDPTTQQLADPGDHPARMLNDFDWFVQRELGCGAYLRYVDDFAMFSDSKSTLYAWKEAVIARLAQERLTIHEAATQVLPTGCGIPWLGFVVYPTHRLLKRRNAVNFTRRFERNLNAYQAGKCSFAELDASVQGWINHVRYADTWGLRGYLFAGHPIPRQAT